jgi:segregation and condensation protein B
MDDTIIPENRLSLTARIEALLFVAPGSVSPAQLAAALEVPQDQIETTLAQLESEYQDQSYDRGIRVQSHQGRYQLTTAKEATPWIERFLGLEAAAKLSRAALETLAIVAYQEPVTRPHIDSIRGVNSDGVLKSLLSKGLIQEIGRAEAPGRPILYSTTSEFLQHFGMISLAELPPLDSGGEIKLGDE